MHIVSLVYLMVDFMDDICDLYANDRHCECRFSLILVLHQVSLWCSNLITNKKRYEEQELFNRFLRLSCF